MEEEKEKTLDINCDIHIANEGLLNNSIKLMDGKYGGGFYANYIHDRSRGVGWIHLGIQYPDGEIGGILLCKNVCMEDNFENEGIGRVALPTVTPLRKGSKPATFQPVLWDSERHGRYLEFQKYERPDMPIPMHVLWKRIIQLWRKLPIVSIGVNCTVDEVYQQLLELGEQKAEEEKAYASADCVFLTKAEIVEVANEAGYEFSHLRYLLELRNLWKKDKNSHGYQKSKKINGTKRNLYALKKRSEIKNDVSPDESYAIPFTLSLEDKEKSNKKIITIIY